MIEKIGFAAEPLVFYYMINQAALCVSRHLNYMIPFVLTVIWNNFFLSSPYLFLLFMQIGELAGLAVGSTVLLNVMFAGY
jgi:hypothetical protein